ncbi:hypothetical protein ACOME3_000612 [Neoechinorhynchus agilis]
MRLFFWFLFVVPLLSKSAISDSDEEFDDPDDLFDLGIENDFDRETTTVHPKQPDDDQIRIVPMRTSSSFLFRGYYWEMFIILIMTLYITWYIHGRQSAFDTSLSWYILDRQNLMDNFALIGDSVNISIENIDERDSQAVVKESDMYYRLWCSGRSGCEGVLVEISLSPCRFCLFHNVLSRLRPKMAKRRLDDILSFSVDLGVIGNVPLSSQQQYESSFIFCAVQKRLAAWHYKKCGDLQAFCSRHRVMVIEFSLKNLELHPSKDLSPALFVTHLIDRLSNFRVTNKQTSNQLEKNRVRAVEARLKQEHQRRQEEAQTRREEKRRAEKDRLMNESDPEKQRKLMERLHKHEVKKKQQKVRGKQVIARM